jgi:replication factor A1
MTKRNISVVKQNIGSNFGFNSNVEPMITSSEQSNNYLTDRREGNTSAINPENLCPINAITPFYNAWTIKARVTAKTSIRPLKRHGGGQVFSFHAIDDTSEIRIVAFNAECHKYFNIIEKNFVYYIAKGIVKTANKKFSNLKSDYEITLTNDSVIEICNENIPLPKMIYKFVEFKDLPNISLNTFVDVIAVIKNISNLEPIISYNSNIEYKKRDILLLDKNSIVVRMKVWGNEAESFNAIKGSIIAVKNALVGDFKGRTLKCVPNTTIEYDPDLPEAHILKGWYDREGQNATNVVSMSKTIDSNASNTFKYLSQINMNSVPNDSTLYFNCRAVIVSTGRPQNSMYKSCGLNGCSKKVRNESNGLYHCDKCGTDSQTFQWRIMLSVCMSDCTGHLWFNAFRKGSEEIIGLKVDELSQIFENDSNQYNSIICGLVYKKFLFRISATQKNNRMDLIIIGAKECGDATVKLVSKKLIQNLSAWAQ